MFRFELCDGLGAVEEASDAETHQEMQCQPGGRFLIPAKCSLVRKVSELASREIWVLGGKPCSSSFAEDEEGRSTDILVLGLMEGEGLTKARPAREEIKKRVAEPPHVRNPSKPWMPLGPFPLPLILSLFVPTPTRRYRTCTDNVKAMAELATSRSTLASIPDTELDAYIANLIVQKSKAKQAHQPGSLDERDTIDAARVPNTNKRFLASVIRNVEGHNHALLRQQSLEERAKAGKGGRVKDTRASAGGPSRLRGWSDDEEEQRDSSGSGSYQMDHGEQEVVGLSSKMDMYFERKSDNGEASDSQLPSRQDKDRSNRSRQKEVHHRQPDRHEGDTGSYRDSILRLSRRAEHPRDKPRRSRCKDEDRHTGRGEHTHRSGSKSSRRHLSHRHHDSPDERERREPRRGDSSRSKHCDRPHRERPHRERPVASRKRSTSPAVEPPKKAREWDMGKDSLVQ